MEREFDRLPQDPAADTVFWGGGTPGLLAARISNAWGGDAAAPERAAAWTIEMAPPTVKADKLAVLRDLGVTRISMGVQSFDADLLESLGRCTDRGKSIRPGASRRLAAQTNLDLMFAIPNQPMNQWEAAIREAARLGPTHLSICLTFERTPRCISSLPRGNPKSTRTANWP